MENILLNLPGRKALKPMLEQWRHENYGRRFGERITSSSN
jgi:hypothetical protein